MQKFLSSALASFDNLEKRLRRMRLDFDFMVAKKMNEEYVNLPSTTSTTKVRVAKPVKPMKINTRLVEILQLQEEDYSLTEISKELKIPKKRINKILITYGFTTVKEKTPYYISTSDEILARDLKLKRKAFMFGVSVAEYIQLRKHIDDDVLNRLVSVVSYSQKNVRYAKNFNGTSVFQMTLLELLHTYVSTGKKTFPGVPPKEALKKVLAKNSGFRLSRIDTSLPFITDNVVVMFRKKY